MGMALRSTRLVSLEALGLLELRVGQLHVLHPEQRQHDQAERDGGRRGDDDPREAAVLDQEQSDERTERVGEDLAEREVADARPVALLGHHSRDDRAGGDMGCREHRAVDEPDRDQDRGAVGDEVRQGEDQAEKESSGEHALLPDAVDVLAAERAGEHRAEDEDACREAGQGRRGAEVVGGVLRDDRHQHQEVHGDEEVLEGDDNEVPGPQLLSGHGASVSLVEGRPLNGEAAPSPSRIVCFCDFDHAIASARGAACRGMERP